MRSLAVLVFLTLPAAAQLPNPVTSGDYFDISGTVLDSVTAKPLAGAKITLQPSAANLPARSSRTDISGNFSFAHVPIGTYNLSGDHGGYAQGAAGSQKLILVSGTQPDRFTLSLDPQAIVNGIVLGPGDKPLQDAEVLALRPEITAGRRRLLTRASTKTDKEGHFQIPGLEAGSCFLAVVAAPPSAQSAYPVTFSPNTIDPAAAQPVILRPGVQQGADVTLTPVPAFHVRGRVLRATDSTNVALLPPVDVTLKLLPAPALAFDRKTGGFDFSGVLPGNYIVQAVSMDANNHETAAYRQISLSASDVNDLTLNISSRSALSGTVHVEGDDRPENVVSLLGLQTSFETSVTAVRGASFDFDGTVAPGSYRLAATLAPNWYLQSATQGGRDVVHTKVTVAEDGSSLPLKITVSPRGATIEGTVTWPDTGYRVPARVIVLEPNDGEMLLAADVKVAPPNEPAVVRPVLIGGLPPGEYVVYAWPEPLTVEFANPAALRPFDPLAQQLSIDEGQQVRVAVKLAIP